jgi:short-subunit dehydrogenase
MRLAGAVALVTGGSSGIGAATALALAGAGASTLIAGRDLSRLEAVARRVSGTALQVDLAEPDGPVRLAKAAIAVAGRVDLLVSNAGFGWAGPTGDMPEGLAAELIAVNLTAPVELTRLLLPAMIERGSGRVILVSSIAGETAVRGEAVYSAAKAGLVSFAESLGHEVHGSGAGVSLVVPGVVDTPFFERRGAPYNRARPAPVRPQRVARAILSAAEHDRELVFVPGWMRFPAWLHGAAPGAFRLIARRLG